MSEMVKFEGLGLKGRINFYSSIYCGKKRDYLFK